MRLGRSGGIANRRRTTGPQREAQNQFTGERDRLQRWRKAEDEAQPGTRVGLRNELRQPFRQSPARALAVGSRVVKLGQQ